MSDAGTARDIGEPGISESEATQLTVGWWIGTAAEIFRRMPRAPGAGEGSRLEQDMGLAGQLMSCLGSLATNSLLLGSVFGVPSGNKAELRDAVAAALARIATPALSAWSSISSQRAPLDVTFKVDQIGMPGPQVAAPPVALKRKPTGHYPSESKCIHASDFSDSGRLSCVTKHRKWTYDTFIKAPQMKGYVREFAGRADIQTSIWRKRYDLAAYIAGRANGKFEIEDDYYSLPNRDQFGGLPSDKVIGDAVHEYLQMKYLDHARASKNAVVSEIDRKVYYFLGGPPGRRPIPIPFWDLVTDGKGPDVIESLAFSLGSKSWHLRPDIVDIDAKLFLEIKPIRSVHKGVLQLWRYVSNYRLAWIFDDIAYRQRGEKQKPIYELRPGFLPDDLLKSFQLFPLLRKKGVGGQYDQYKGVWVEPMMVSSLPGLVIYRLRQGNPEEDRDGQPSLIREFIKGLFVAAAVVVVAFLLISVAPALLTAAAALIGAIGAGIIGGIELITPIRRPLPSSLVEMIPVLHEAVTNESAQLGADAARLIRSMNTQVATP